MEKNVGTDVTQKIMSLSSKGEIKIPVIEPVQQPSGEAPSVTIASNGIEKAPSQLPQFPDTSYPPLSRQARRFAMEVQAIQEQCRHLCLSVFFRDQAPARSLGFTSSLAGEGKTLLAMMTANVLAQDSYNPVTLLECNWEHPCLHEHFRLPPAPGLAEWLRGECDKASIIHQVHPNLFVIPAGNGQQDAMRLIQRIRQQNLSDLLALSNAFLVVDLPAIAPTAYGLLASSLVEALIVVVHAGVTPDTLVAETCTQLKHLPVEGVILNQIESRIPRWLRHML